MQQNTCHKKRSSAPAARHLMKKTRKECGLWALLFGTLMPIACNKFVDVPPPTNKITTQELFKDDENATSAVLGIYSQISFLGLNIVNGASTVYTGLASDELKYIGSSVEINEYMNNAISTTNSTNQGNIWFPAYRFIYQTNACLEGISGSNGISQRTKNQLLGECRVARSILYFYLVQLYGDVPLITTSNYESNSSQERSPTDEIYRFITNDLKEAKALLAEAYPSPGRFRPNTHTAEALLARIFLYTGNWKQAETEASNVINSTQYTLEADLTKVFLVNSSEAIWQLAAVGGGINTREGATFVSGNPSATPNFLISPQLMSAIEPNDPRKNAWIGTKNVNNKTYYYPFKYKVPIAADPVITESYMMLRLAEQYLIRSEVKIRQGKIDDGIRDLNIIRKRARGSNSNTVPDLPTAVTQDEALSFVLHERRIELMAEWGNRWFDLKRFHLSTTILKPLKSSWQDTDTLLPIPNQEILLNKNLTQNNGYN
ncbi:RagB/SusD family nutrient uptake outer membrane protein [Chitinophaga eiseniae]|nr:RagB/SusD family nutrient uptake outer membrane protein [Chitinophaga eiseniae]